MRAMRRGKSSAESANPGRVAHLAKSELRQKGDRSNTQKARLNGVLSTKSIRVRKARAALKPRSAEGYWTFEGLERWVVEGRRMSAVTRSRLRRFSIFLGTKLRQTESRNHLGTSIFNFWNFFRSRIAFFLACPQSVSQNREGIVIIITDL